MRVKHIYILIVLLFCTSGIYAQLGIKAGVNMANEIESLSDASIASNFNSNNLTGYHIGLTYQIMPKKSGLGLEIAALLSQKGSSYNDSTDLTNIRKGYRELNYLEIPLNLRYRLTTGFIGIYTTAGIYGAYALNGKLANEVTNVTEQESYANFMSHLDYGLNVGLGLELLRKIQFGATWTIGLKNTANANLDLSSLSKTKNSVFSINLVYMLH